MGEPAESEALPEEEDAYLAHCRWLWEDGNFLGVYLGFLLSQKQTKHLPRWLFKAVDAALREQLLNGGADERGRKGGYFAQVQQASVHYWRWQAMVDAMERGCKKPAEEAAEMLRGVPGQGTPRQIRESYKRMEAAFNSPNYR